MITVHHVLGIASALRERQGLQSRPPDLESALRAWIAAHPRECAVVEKQEDTMVMIRHWEELAGLRHEPSVNEI
jgi:hypothetical protein